MFRGLAGRDPEGLRLATLLMVAFMPAAVIGLLAEKAIKRWLFGPWPVVAALAAGGVAMIVEEAWRARRAGKSNARDVGSMTMRAALIVGCCQCLAMWPGTSRSMTTIVAALLLGLTPRAAAEFSFLLALPTLGAATLHDAVEHGGAIVHAAGAVGLAIGFVTSAIVAWLAVKGLLAWLNRHGLVPFGVYRIAAAIVFVIVYFVVK
jgi:undecaprenyl-diphosphatase